MTFRADPSVREGSANREARGGMASLVAHKMPWVVEGLTAKTVSPTESKRSRKEKPSAGR